MDASRLSDLCQKIYFPTEDYTIATFVTVHVSLFLLFRQMQKDTAKELQLGPIEIEACVATCSKNAETAMRSMRVYVEANYESIEALLLAAMMALELSRPSLAWALITTATRMVQDAGYHRLPAYSVAPEATKKRLLFWFIYAIDRCMALNLGRSPSLQDYDITTEWPKIPEELDGPFGRMYLGWISLGELQGQIYEQLYCARAQRQPPELRAQLARSLASKLLEMKDYFEIDFEGQPFAEACSENLSSSRICLASILTLIYRMIPADPLPSGLPPHPLKFNDLAVQSAREAVTMHNNAWDTLKYRERNEWHLFVHWTMLWSPFIPYIVVFGNTIADRNAADLELLKAVVSGLESVADMSPGVGKLYRACRIFYQIASMVLAQDGVGNESVLQESVADSSAADRTRTYNDLLNQLTNAPPASAVEHAANLIVFIDAVLSSSLGIINIRPILASIIKSLLSVPAEVKVKVGKHIADALQSQLASYEEQDAAVREILAQGYEAEEEYTAAAKALQGIHLDSTQRQVSDRSKVETWVKIVRYYLEDDDTVSAETALNKIKNSAAAAQVLKDSPDLRLLYQLSQARIMDSRRDFLNASAEYLNVSFNTMTDEDDRRRALSAAIKTAILAPAGPHRSRTLAKLYKDERSTETEEYGILENMFLDRLLSPADVEVFASTLAPHQL
ncbi:hypothetical protein LTR40_009348, partial [Exophiala xenobiotica]